MSYQLLRNLLQILPIKFRKILKRRFPPRLIFFSRLTENGKFLMFSCKCFPSNIFCKYFLNIILVKGFQGNFNGLDLRWFQILA